MSETTKNSNPVGLTYGFIGGVLLVILNLIIYKQGVHAYMGILPKLGYVLVAVVAVIAALQVKKRQGGFLSLREGFRVLFAVFALSFLLLTIYNYILFNYVDIAFRDAVTKALVESTREMMTRFGASEDEIERMTAGSSDPQQGYGLGGMLMGFAFICIFLALISLIIALIMRKKRDRNDEPLENSFNQ